MTETPEMSIYEKTFAQSDKTDAILVVDGKKLHVNKVLLSVHSDYFKSLFNRDFTEKPMEEIEIKDVNFEDFATLLSLIQPNPLKPTLGNAERLLQLADRFLLPGAKRHLELFFLTTNIGRLEKVRIADKYGLEDLLDHGIGLYTMYTDYGGLRTNATFQKLSDHCKAKLLIRIMVLLNLK